MDDVFLQGMGDGDDLLVEGLRVHETHIEFDTPQPKRRGMDIQKVQIPVEQSSGERCWASKHDERHHSD